jgi:hypothetical protein
MITDLSQVSTTDTRLDYIASLLEKLVSRNLPADPPTIYKIGSGTTHVRLRGQFLIITNRGANSNPVLSIGRLTYTFSVPEDSTVYFPFPIVIDRGIDTSNTDSDVDMYLIASVE